MIRSIFHTFTVASVLLLNAPAQEQPALPKLVADVRQSIAQNQSRLRSYTWTETTEVSLKGEVKKREQAECRYDPSGKLIKTPIGAPAEPKKEPRGLKGKMVAKKADEMKDYMDRVGSLVHRYVPPSPQTMKAAFDAGKAAIGKSEDGGTATLLFRDYAKPGDTMTLQIDLRTKMVHSFTVETYLDEPADAVRLNAMFSTLDGGVNYVEHTVLDATAKEIQIKTTNFGHHK